MNEVRDGKNNRNILGGHPNSNLSKSQVLPSGDESTINDPDAHLSSEQRQIKDDLFKLAHHNPEEVLAGRIAPLNIEARKLSNLIRKKKEQFIHLLLYIRLDQIRKDLAKMQSHIFELLDQLREMRIEILEAIDKNNQIIDKVEIAQNSV